MDRIDGQPIDHNRINPFIGILRRHPSIHLPAHPLPLRTVLQPIPYFTRNDTECVSLSNFVGIVVDSGAAAADSQTFLSLGRLVLLRPQARSDPNGDPWYTNMMCVDLSFSRGWGWVVGGLGFGCRSGFGVKRLKASWYFLSATAAAAVNLIWIYKASVCLPVCASWKLSRELFITQWCQMYNGKSKTSEKEENKFRFLLGHFFFFFKLATAFWMQIRGSAQTQYVYKKGISWIGKFDGCYVIVDSWQWRVSVLMKNNKLKNTEELCNKQDVDMVCANHSSFR